MASVTLNGHTYTDDSDPSTGLANGGHRTRFVPALSDMLVVAGSATSAANAAYASANSAAASAQTAVNAPGTSATSTTSLTIGTGSKSLAIQPGKALVVGMSVKVAYTTAPTNWMYGDVTSYDSGTGSLTVNVTKVSGSGSYSNWTVSLSGAAAPTTAWGDITGAPTTLPGFGINYLNTNLVAYDSRATLRSLTPASGDLMLVEFLGLFRWVSGSTEPDDDETCFVTTSGAWLLECPHWDLVDATQYPDESAQDDRIEDAEVRLASAESRWPGSVLRAIAACSITSVSATSSASFTASIPGAAIGDAVIATPPDALGPRLSVVANVSSAGTITITLNNPSAASQTIATGSWKITVIKEA